MSALSGISVLLVEDEYLIALDAQEVLRNLGVAKVEIAATLDEAAERAKEGAFDLAVLDVNLNGKQSFSVASILRERGVPIVFASGYELRDRIPPGMNGVVCVTKPYTATRLAEALFSAIKANADIR